MTEKKNDNASAGDKRPCRRPFRDRFCQIPVFTVLFFLALFVYVYVWIEPPLLYYSFGVYTDYPHFSLSWSFVERCLAEPGGPVRLVCGFLSQWFVYPFAGAAIIAASAWLAFAATQSLFREVSHGLRRVLGHLVALTLIVGYNQYDHPLAVWLALTVAIWSAALYQRWNADALPIRLGVFSIGFGAAYYLSGAAALLFAILAIGISLADKRYLSALLHLAISLSLVLLLGYGFFVLEIQEAFLRLTPFHPTIRKEFDPPSRIALQGICVLIVLAFLAKNLLRSAGGNHFLSGPFSSTADKAAAGVSGGSNRGFPALIKGLLAYGIPSVAYVLLLVYSRGANKEILRIHALSRQKNWPQVLESVRTLYQQNRYDPCCNFDVNRALYHTGSLPYEMFAHPQHPEALTLISIDTIPVSQRYNRICDLYYELGYMNEAQHWAAELLETRGNCPFLLDKLARICIVKELPEAARIFLNALQKDLIYRKTARQLLDGLEQDPKTANDSDMASLASIRRQDNHAAKDISLEDLLLELLAENKSNRMAFEYLMAYYLLNRQSDKVVAHLHRLKGLGYPQLPRYYAEAAMIHMSKTRQPVDLGGYEMDPRIVAEFQQITNAFRSLNYDRQQGQQALAAQFGDSYFYYSMFDVGIK
ncbi:MAG: hypothetical protein JW828_11430 [Sedimentisphaerales bacterium]|nr:hypothetical protein [Sedimentisphaerales bacterium]